MQTATECLILIGDTLQIKEKIYKEICQWFENEYNSSSCKDKVLEMEKRAVEIDSQIKLLRFLQNEICS